MLRFYTQAIYNLLVAMLIMGLIVIIGCGEIELPVADSGKDTDAVVGVPKQLDGRKSRSNNGAPLTYQWSIINRPEGSAATLINDESARPIFTPDKTGDYTFSLVVSDGEMRSDPVIVTVNVIEKDEKMDKLPQPDMTVDSTENGDAIPPKDITPENERIVPGNRISDFSLGQTFGQIVKKHGQPDDSEAGMFFYQSGIGGAIFDENGNGNIDNFEKLLMIGACSPFQGETSGGNGVGSPVKSFEREFGLADEVDGNTHAWWGKGISVDENRGKAEMIFVFPLILDAAPSAHPKKTQTPFPDLRDFMNRIESLRY